MRNSHGHGYRVSLRCFSCEEYDSCGKKQEPPVQVSSVHPTELACLQELLKRLQDRHVECAQAVAKKATADAQAAAAVSLAEHRCRAKLRQPLRDARAPADQEPRRNRRDVSEEKFERRHALVQDENF